MTGITSITAFAGTFTSGSSLPPGSSLSDIANRNSLKNADPTTAQAARFLPDAPKSYDQQYADQVKDYNRQMKQWSFMTPDMKAARQHEFPKMPTYSNPTQTFVGVAAEAVQTSDSVETSSSFECGKDVFDMSPTLAAEMRGEGQGQPERAPHHVSTKNEGASFAGARSTMATLIELLSKIGL